ncbi:MAG: arginine deiminase-related protein [Flavobacteriales bacterium]|nr:arginine deiminase-related protein [Flavobacteriales bacterium]
MAEQNTSHMLMIRPIAFESNSETAEDNHYQHEIQGLSDTKTQNQALQEFDSFVGKLRDAGINIIVVEDTPESKTPDSIFPNNWISMHGNGVVVLYPMYAPNRRKERRLDILETLKEKGFHIKEVIDLSPVENEGRILEGTGSLVLDHENSIAYACLSHRTNEKELERWAKLTDYKTVPFHALQNVEGQLLPIYHTNVMMSVGKELAIVCADSIKDETERKTLIDSLKKTGKQMVFISEEQKSSFAGNMLQVVNNMNEKIMVMSSQAFESLTAEQISTIEKTNRILHSPLNTIEALGGGSARCMMAEVFLPLIR